MSTAAPATPLPALRSDLVLLEAAPAREGQPRWLIHDPLQQRYIQIEATAHRLLTLWSPARTAFDLAKAMFERFHVEIDVREIEAFSGFLKANHLTAGAAGDWRRLYEAGQQRRSLAWRILHGYLFFRIPLVRPNRFLRATWPFVSFLFTRGSVIGLAFIGLAGLYLVSRQWDAFLSTFSYLFSFDGVIAFGVALVLVKLAHELGHAYMAVRFGCHVPTMGIAFVVLAPMPYTDVTDAWRLTDRRQRLMIDAAGMMVEIGIAAVATFLWAFLPDGPARSVVFTLATASWLMSLAVNLSPLMRFDGYYLLSDLLGVENLQQRAFALGRWRLRELLFGIGFAAPERFPPRLHSLLIAYAWFTWLYRLVLFFGIALFVYHYFFKALGILLFLVEIGYFIALPIASEFVVWFHLRRLMARSRRSWVTAGILTAGVAILFVPWSGTVHVPALLEVEETAQLFPPVAARVERVDVTQGERVAAGQRLMTLRAPALEREIRLAEIKLELTRLRLARGAGDDVDRAETTILQNERTALESRLAGLENERRRLVVTSPMAGVVLELNPSLHAGRWLSVKEMLALVGDPNRLAARGYLAERDLWRVQPGAEARFVPDMPTRPSVVLRLHDVSRAGVAALDLVELASTAGGPVPTRADPQQRQVPTSGQYLSHFRAAGSVEAGPERAIRGVVHVQGEPESFAAAIWRQILRVLVREAGA
ncbi:Peptidase family M50 [bacterium YEK0313]|nr:Peptidase family M50 [bacterium YEK0313]